MNKNILTCLVVILLTVILNFGFNAIVEANNNFRYDADKPKPESTVGTLKRSVYYEKEAVDLLREIRNQLALEEKESVKLLREIRDMLKKNTR